MLRQQQCFLFFVLLVRLQYCLGSDLLLWHFHLFPLLLLLRFHFQRIFKNQFGLTIGQLKQQEKTLLAKTLLENGKLSTDVAYEVGFFDQSHFIKYFKKMWATTPKNL